MRADELELVLRQRVAEAPHGEKLPPVREMMREYRVGQAVIQEILGRMAKQGLLRLRVGHGTFVHKPDQRSASPVVGARVLVLSDRIQSERSHRVARIVQQRLAAAGARCVQLVYQRVEEALEVMRLGARFDACVLQSYFDTIPIGLLAFMRERCGAVIVDGARVTGVDLDAVASDWRGALDIALERAVGLGHRRIAMLAWPGTVQPLEGLRHHFVSLRRSLRRSADEMPLIELERLPHPQHGDVDAVGTALRRAWSAAAAERPTALIALNIGPAGAALETAIERLRLAVPRDLGVIVLGHTDVPDKAVDRFDMVGSRSEDAAHTLVEQVCSRLESPAREYRTVYLANAYREAGSFTRPAGRRG